ncbi:MAG: hypothetical protein ACRDKS_02840 [Actinomycetota bacterium]
MDQDEAEIAELLEDMLVNDPVETIPIDDRFGRTAAEKWRTVMAHTGPLADMMPEAAAPSAAMRARIADTMALHASSPLVAEDEAAELAETIAEHREERLELAAGRAAIGGLAGALAVTALWLWLGIGRRRRRVDG